MQRAILVSVGQQRLSIVWLRSRKGDLGFQIWSRQPLHFSSYALDAEKQGVCGGRFVAEICHNPANQQTVYLAGFCNLLLYYVFIYPSHSGRYLKM